MNKNEAIINEVLELLRKFEPNTDDRRVDLFFLCACHTKGDDGTNIIGALQGKPGQLLATVMTTDETVNRAVKEAVVRNQAPGLADVLSMVFGSRSGEGESKEEASVPEEKESNGE